MATRVIINSSVQSNWSANTEPHLHEAASPLVLVARSFSLNRTVMPPRVYVDFNAIEYLDSERTSAELSLSGYGTLASLARQRVRLLEGMAVLLYEPNDIECEAVVHFDISRRDPAGRRGEWVARFDPKVIRDCDFDDDPLQTHPGIVCGHDFWDDQGLRGSNYTESCKKCGASAMEPLAPPGHPPQALRRATWHFMFGSPLSNKKAVRSFWHGGRGGSCTSGIRSGKAAYEELARLFALVLKANGTQRVTQPSLDDAGHEASSVQVEPARRSTIPYASFLSA